MVTIIAISMRAMDVLMMSRGSFANTYKRLNHRFSYKIVPFIAVDMIFIELIDSIIC